jgi:hypothetical protein
MAGESSEREDWAVVPGKRIERIGMRGTDSNITERETAMSGL